MLATDIWKPSYLKHLIKDIPDFPKPGIVFKDITPLLADRLGFQSMLHQLGTTLYPVEFDKLVVTESRGFLIGSPLAALKHCGLVLARKPGKLPREAWSATYSLEYGTDRLEMHKGDILEGERVIIIDDVLATGGTAAAVESLCRMSGAKVVGHRFLIELMGLKGREKLEAPVTSILKY